MTPQTPSPRVSIIVGSTSDSSIVAICRRTLDAFAIPHEARVLSAHRCPDELRKYLSTLATRGVKVIIAAAGMAAHLPGVVAAHTMLPVLGVPIAVGPLAGVDALLSIAQMPGGVPVGCMGVGAAGAKNAAYMAARMLAVGDATVATKLADVIRADHDKVMAATLPEN